MKIGNIFKIFTNNSSNLSKTTNIRGLDDSWYPNYREGVVPTNTAGEINMETLYTTCQSSPEVYACIQAIVEDIMADSWRFIGSKSAEEKARKFSIVSDFYKILNNAIWDLIITGNAYILKLSVDDEDIKNFCVEMTKSISEKLNIKLNKKTVYELVDIPNDSVPRDLQVLKSSTMTINYDDTGKISSFIQEVSGQKRVYNTKDIIHLSLTNFGGQPYGFSPLSTVLGDVATLLFAKQYAGKYFENDGIPSWIFKMPDENPDSRNYKLLKNELNEFRKTANKFRSMVLTGNIDPIQLEKFNKDLEFPKLIQHFTQVIIMALGVPAHRINYTLDVKSSDSQTGKIETGYFKKISFLQKLIEDSLNKFLWQYFNVEMKFFKSYKIDEMREAQIAQIASQSGFMTVEEIRERMGLEPELPKGTMLNSIGDNNAIDFVEDKKRQNGQDNKTEEIPVDNKLKMFKSMSDAIEVSFEKFVRIVEGRATSFDKGNIVYLETGDQYVFFFNDNSWTYKSKVFKNEIEDLEDFNLKYLVNAIKISY